MANKLIEYMESDFWFTKISVPLYWPMQLFATQIIPGVNDIRSWFCFNVLRLKPLMKFKIEEVMVQPANVCNARCHFCVLSKNKIKMCEKFMSTELFKKALAEIRKQGRNAITLTPTVGEILIDHGIFEKIKYVKSCGVTVHSYTNGILLYTNENYKKLVESGIDRITISLSDLDPKIEAKSFGIPVSLAKHKMKGIRKLLDYNHKRKNIKEIYLSFRQTRHPHAIVMQPAFKALRKYQFKYNFMLRWDSWGGVIKQKDLNKYMRIVSFRKYKKYPCKSLNIFSVLPSGSVRLCSCRVIDNLEDDFVISNLHKDSLNNILKSDRIKKIKKSFERGKYPSICEDCTFYRSEY